MQTSFDTPRVASNNPFASYTPAPSSNSNSYFFGASSSYYDQPAASDPWSTSPVASTSAATNLISSSNNLQDGAFSAIIDDTVLPKIYNEAFRAAVASSSSTSSAFPASNGHFAANSTVSLTTLHKVLSSCANLPAREVEKIINIVSSATGVASASVSPQTSPLRSSHSPSSRIGRAEFIVALGLVGLVQEKKAPSIEGLAARRTSPPNPKLDLSALQTVQQAASATTSPRKQRSAGNTESSMSGYSTSPPASSRLPKMSLGSTSDPWNTSPKAGLNGTSGPLGNVSSGPLASDISGQTNGVDQYPAYSNYDDNVFPGPSPYDSMERTRSSAGTSETQGLPAFQGSLDASRSSEEINVIQLPRLAGSWINRYTVYLVSSKLRNTTTLTSSRTGGLGELHLNGVERRYSDWLWLHECLVKKYPARMILTLPPKRVGISARHLQLSSSAAEQQFLERRRKGLARYLTFITNHPILKNDRLLEVFLTEKLDLATWRKNNIDLDLSDESFTLRLSPSQESLIPVSLEAQLHNMTSILPTLIDSLTRFCALLERIQARSVANSSDILRAKMSLETFNEAFSSTGLAGLSSRGSTEASTYQDPSRLSQSQQYEAAHPSVRAGGYGRSKEVEEELTILTSLSLPKFTSSLSSLSEMADFYHSETFETSTLERYKLQRESWRALLELVQRYDSKLKIDNVDKLKKRIEGCQSRYQSIAQAAHNGANGDGVNPQSQEELKKILQSIERDQEGIKAALDRRVALKWCLAQELRHAWRTSTNMRVILRDWSVEENAFQQRVAREWQGVEDAMSMTE